VAFRIAENEKIFLKNKLNPAIPSKIIRLNKTYKFPLGTFLVNINNEFLKFKNVFFDYPVVVWLRPHDIPLICNYTLSYTLFIARQQRSISLMGKKIIKPMKFFINIASYEKNKLLKPMKIFIVVLSLSFSTCFKKRRPRQ
jgi:hypothetical protein